MFKFIGNLTKDAFFKWLFSPSGMAVLSVLGGFSMLSLNYFTTALQELAPLSYGVAFLIGVLAILWILNLSVAIWQKFSGTHLTKEATFLEFKVEHGRINLIAKGNIYKEPNTSFVNNHQVTLPTPGANRRDRRAKEAMQIAPVVSQLPHTAQIIVQFEKAIAPSSFHLRLEGIVGQCPVRDTSALDERWAIITLSNILDNCSFRIRFN